jgi:glycosyltransferase involved in cell wall biosynthesis
VTLITLDHANTDVFAVDSRVNRVGLGLMSDSAHRVQGLWNNLKRVRKVREAIRAAETQIAVSLTDKMNIVTLLACRPLQVPVVISERSDPGQQDLGRIWEWLRRRSYPRCRAAVVQTESVAKQLQALVGADRVHVIPNGVKSPSQTWEDHRSLPPRILAVGRLSHEKGFDLLIRAFARLAEGHGDWELLIAGEGQQRSSLERLAVELRVAERVSLPGWVDSPNQLLCSSRVFVLPSRYEGFPNALLEAMASGAPVVSFDCESGPREIIRHNINGLLAPAEDVPALASGIERLMTDDSLRVRLGQQAREVVERFSEESYFDRWDQVLRGDIESVND